VKAMLPKKKSTTGAVIGFVVAALIAFLALHGSAAHTDIQNSEEAFEGFEGLTAFAEAFQQRLETPFNIEWNENSAAWLLITGFIFFIVVAQMTMTKKKTIAGKEHGTAKWSTQSDIRDLFAANILKAEIKKIKMTRFFLTRYFIKRRIFKECEKIGAIHKAEALERLKNSPWNNREHKKSEIERIKQETAEFIKKAKMEAWLPYRLEVEYRNAIKELKGAGKGRV